MKTTRDQTSTDYAETRAGRGLSSIWGKLADNPSVHQNLLAFQEKKTAHSQKKAVSNNRYTHPGEAARSDVSNIEAWRSENYQRYIENSMARGAMGGVGGMLVGGGISALWGKLRDKPSVRRDLIASLVGGLVGTTGGIASAALKAERMDRTITQFENQTVGVRVDPRHVTAPPS